MKTFLLTSLLLLVTSINAQILVMETGQVTITHVVTTVTLNNTFIDPVVIALPPSYNGSHEVALRLDNVTGTSFDIYIEEPENRDGPHTTETIHYVVVEKGRYTFGDGTMLEAGTVSSSNLNFQSVTLLQTYGSTPAIFTQVQTDHSSTNFLHTRQRSSTTSSFEVKLEREESLNGTSPSGSEDIGYFAISQGGGILDGVIIEAGQFSADEVTVTNSFTESFSSGLHFIASASTFGGGDPITLRYTALSAASVSAFLDEDIANDGETNHVFETVDFFAIDDNGGAGIFLPILLPIELISFDASIQNEKVHLEWITASEINNDYFTIERSSNGKDWEVIGTVDGAGNSSSRLDYDFVDDNPMVNLSYYRLKQTDFNGDFEYSDLRSINMDNLTRISIYPNPSANRITVETEEASIGDITVYNAVGQDITSELVVLTSTNSSISFDLESLSTGVYFVKTKWGIHKVYKI